VHVITQASVLGSGQYLKDSQFIYRMLPTKTRQILVSFLVSLFFLENVFLMPISEKSQLTISPSTNYFFSDMFFLTHCPRENVPDVYMLFTHWNDQCLLKLPKLKTLAAKNSSYLFHSIKKKNRVANLTWSLVACNMSCDSSQNLVSLNFGQ